MTSLKTLLVSRSGFPRIFAMNFGGLSEGCLQQILWMAPVLVFGVLSEGIGEDGDVAVDPCNKFQRVRRAGREGYFVVSGLSWQHVFGLAKPAEQGNEFRDSHGQRSFVKNRWCYLMTRIAFQGCSEQAYGRNFGRKSQQM